MDNFEIENSQDFKKFFNKFSEVNTKLVRKIEELDKTKSEIENLQQELMMLQRSIFHLCYKDNVMEEIFESKMDKYQNGEGILIINGGKRETMSQDAYKFQVDKFRNVNSSCKNIIKNDREEYYKEISNNFIKKILAEEFNNFEKMGFPDNIVKQLTKQKNIDLWKVNKELRDEILLEKKSSYSSLYYGEILDNGKICLLGFLQNHEKLSSRDIMDYAIDVFFDFDEGKINNGKSTIRKPAVLKLKNDKLGTYVLYKKGLIEID